MTGLPHQGDGGELLAIAADDDLVTALAAGQPVEDDDLAALLTRFRGELEAAYDAGDLATAPIPVPPAGRPRRLRRGAAIGVVTVTVAASLTGVAAAVGGDANPLHRAITRIVEPRPDRSLHEAQQLLADVEAMASSARARGWITDPDREAILAALDRVLVLVSDDSTARRQPIEARVLAVRTLLAGLPSGPKVEPSDDAEHATAPEPGESQNASTPDDRGDDGPAGSTEDRSETRSEPSAAPHDTEDSSRTSDGSDDGSSDSSGTGSGSSTQEPDHEGSAQSDAAVVEPAPTPSDSRDD